MIWFFVNSSVCWLHVVDYDDHSISC